MSLDFPYCICVSVFYQTYVGVCGGVTLGTPIALLVRNEDHRSGDYKEMEVKYRPSHADATYDAK
jgi:chorismate synthase